MPQSGKFQGYGLTPGLAGWLLFIQHRVLKGFCFMGFVDIWEPPPVVLLAYYWFCVLTRLEGSLSVQLTVCLANALSAVLSVLWPLSFVLFYLGDHIWQCSVLLLAWQLGARDRTQHAEYSFSSHILRALELGDWRKSDFQIWSLTYVCTSFH